MRLVTATRGDIYGTLLYKSTRNIRKGQRLKIIAAQHNSRGLPYVYNRSISDETLCFCHDDVAILDLWWTEVVEEGLKHYDIVGVAGNRRIPETHASWCILDWEAQPPTLDRENMSGAIAQGSGFPCERIDYFGPCGEVKLLDGVFIAVKGETLLRTGLRFDEDFDFHFYDLSFCQRAHQLGLKIGTIPLSLAHNSLGRMDEIWLHALHRYRGKYG